MSWTKQILISVSLVVLSINPSFAVWKENAKAIDISGGEDHTLVLTRNKSVWACGDNTYYQLGIENNDDKITLVRALKGDMNSPWDYLEDINDVDPGWKHLLALDVNDFT